MGKILDNWNLLIFLLLLVILADTRNSFKILPELLDNIDLSILETDMNIFDIANNDTDNSLAIISQSPMTGWRLWNIFTNVTQIQHTDTGYSLPSSGFDARVKAMLKRHEGTVIRNGLHVPYRDSLGYWTVGYGHLLGKPMSQSEVNKVGRIVGHMNWHARGGLTHSEANALFEHDYAVHLRELTNTFSWVNGLDDVRRAVLIDMNFNMGTKRLSGFHNSLRYIKNGQYQKAGYNLTLSKWYGQTGNRPKRLIKMMNTGRWQ